MEKYIEVEENFWGAERGAHVSLVSPSLHFPRHDRLRAWFFVFEFGLWCLFGFLLCFLVRCLGNFDLIFILISLLTDNVTHRNKKNKEDSRYVPTPEHERMKLCSQIWEKRKKSFLQSRIRFFRRFWRGPVAGELFCSNTKVVATGRMTKVATLVYRLVEGLLPEDVIMKEEMIKVLHLHGRTTLWETVFSIFSGPENGSILKHRPIWTIRKVPCVWADFGRAAD